MKVKGYEINPYADLQGAYLWRAVNIPAIVLNETSILPDGDIIGYKKCNKGVIVKLLIPKDAKRSNATGRKCRAEYVKVLEIFGDNKAITNTYGPSTEYIVGETIYCDKWDNNRWNECSGGIHFFITRGEAERY